MPRTTDAPGDAAVPMLAEQVMPLLVANCPGIQCKMVGACCYSRCHATQEIARKLDALADARPVVAAARAVNAAYVRAESVGALRDTPRPLLDACYRLNEALFAGVVALAARDGGAEEEERSC